MPSELSEYRKNLLISRRAEQLFVSERTNPLETFELDFFERGTYKELPYWIGVERQAELKARAEKELRSEGEI